MKNANINNNNPEKFHNVSCVKCCLFCAKWSRIFQEWCLKVKVSMYVGVVTQSESKPQVHVPRLAVLVCCAVCFLLASCGQE